MSMQTEADIAALKRHVAELEAKLAEVLKWISERRSIITRPIK